MRLFKMGQKFPLCYIFFLSVDNEEYCFFKVSWQLDQRLEELIAKEL